MSNNKLQPVRGTHDLIAADAQHYLDVVASAREVARCFGYQDIMTPLFEFSDVFHRTLGETSDVVSKETYSFTDRGGEALTLRPEFTASVVRAFISHGLADQAPCKFFYAGPAFRYERPQKGRQRQFHQIGVELLGAPEVQADIETIALGHQLLASLGLSDLVSLELNSLGDAESRAAYRVALVEYFQGHRDGLSEDSQARLEKNPMRILDSKSEADKVLVAGAPKGHDYFTPQASEFFAQLQEGLGALGIEFQCNDRLVRGLDYYNHTVFEFTTQALGSQNAVLAGGRYDGLVAQMGGPDTAGIGFAAGVERLMALREQRETLAPVAPRPIVMIPLGEAQQMDALKLACELRAQGFVIEQGYRGNMGKRMKKADKQLASAVLILGEDEQKAGLITLRDMQHGTEQKVVFGQLAAALTIYKG